MGLLSAWKNSLKNLAALVLYRTGAVCLLNRIILRNRCVVLAYHRVCDAGEAGVPIEEGMSVSTKTFEDHLKYLRKKYRLLSLDSFLSSLWSGVPFRRACLITFDDGWADTYRNAFPLLRKYGIPAVVFLTTDYMGTDDWFWPEKVSYLFSSFEARTWDSCRTEEARQAVRIYRSRGTDPAQGIHEAIQYLKQFDTLAIQDILTDLMRASGTERFPPVRAILTWSEANEMAQWGISFGSHTRRHVILTRVQDPEVIQNELCQSRQTISERTGREAVAFCFPNGDFNDHLIAAVRTCGYRAAFIGARGFVAASDDPYKLKRISLHQSSAPNTARLACRILFPWF